MSWLILTALLLQACQTAPLTNPVSLVNNTQPVQPTVSPTPYETTCSYRWQHTTVNGGGGQTALAVNPIEPNIIYATTDHGGIIKSMDSADTWQTINNNIGTMRLADVQLDPLNPQILYVSAAPLRNSGEGELFRSIDGGDRWVFVTDTFGVEKWPSTRALLILPQDENDNHISDVIYAGGWAGNQGGSKGGIWKSNDEGETWEQIGHINDNGDILNRSNVWVLRHDPSNSDILYAGMYVYGGTDTLGGILKSMDGGYSWTDITSNIPVRNISDIAITPDGKTLYVATNTFYNSDLGAGIFKSSDGGQTWKPINRGLERTSLKFEVLLMDKDNPNLLYAGPYRTDESAIYRTIDGGENWERTKFDHSGWWAEYFSNTWAITEGSDSKLYVGTWSGIYRSDDDGQVWLARSQGLGNVIVYDLALDPQNPSTVYLGLGDIGPWKSMDGGQTWTQINKGYYAPYNTNSGGVSAFAISPSNPNIIYSAVRGPDGHPLSGVNKTLNSGKKWTAINKGLPDPDNAWIANSIVVHPTNPDIAYVGIQINENTGAIFKTTNGGKEWIELTSINSDGKLPRILSLAISNTDPNVILIGTQGPGHVYKTSNQGKDWLSITPPLEMMNRNTIVYDIEIHPQYSEHILIGTNSQGAYRTTDGGLSWSHIFDIEYVRSNSQDVALNPNGPLYATVKAVKFDPVNPQIIYIGHDNHGRAGLGVLKSTDGGASWISMSDSGLQYRNIYAIDIDPYTKELYVGGFDGIYKYQQNCVYTEE